MSAPSPTGGREGMTEQRLWGIERKVRAGFPQTREVVIELIEEVHRLRAALKEARS